MQKVGRGVGFRHPVAAERQHIFDLCFLQRVQHGVYLIAGGIDAGQMGQRCDAAVILDMRYQRAGDLLLRRRAARAIGNADIVGL